MKVDNLSPHLLYYSKYQDIKKASSFSRILNNRSRRKEYKKEEFPDFIHQGQRKLLLSEIEFLTNEYDKFDKENKIFLYIGASAGKGSVHSYLLAKMFPEIEFHLWDKNEFYPKLDELSNVKIFKRWFLKKDAKNYRKKNVFLVSDLRDPDIGKAKNNNNTNRQNSIVFNDMDFQRELYEKIKPKSALFKFRLPWRPGKTEYLDGTIYYQCWQGPHSTETRLVPNGKLKVYDNTGYEQRLFYFNTETRRRYYPHTYKCYGHCYDCMSELFILCQYIDRFKVKATPCDLGRKITEHLSVDKNKRLFKKFPLNKSKI
jgi:cap2 methyltransferase